MSGRWTVLWLLAASSLANLQAGEIVVQDIFGRRLNEHGITLVDWEGYIANPAIKILIAPPSDAAFPATALLSANNVRLYFDMPSQVGAGGPSKTINFPNASTQVPVYISNFPDRDTLDDDSVLTIQFTGSDGSQQTLAMNVHEIDQDTTNPAPYQITVDFSQDQTGLFTDAQKQAIVQQAADDWAYFIDDMALDPVPAGDEMTWVYGPTGYPSGGVVTNANAYTGFLLYSYGIHTDRLTSGGEPSLQGKDQTSGGTDLQLRRSGGTEIETAGNYNTLGWFLTTGDADWWVSGNLGNEPNDFYSIPHHEMGHAYIFNPIQPNFATFKNAGAVQDPAVLAYHGSYPKIDQNDHLAGEIDNASHRGAFGNEYFGDVPARRWLITKLDILVAQAIGYKIRQTSAFVPLSITNTSLADGIAGQAYSDAVSAAGGIPFYNFSVDSGQLPPGLTLDSFTGAISGTPAASGTYNFTVRVQEYVEGSAGVTSPFTINIS